MEIYNVNDALSIIITTVLNVNLKILQFWKKVLKAKDVFCRIDRTNEFLNRHNLHFQIRLTENYSNNPRTKDKLNSFKCKSN